MKAGIPIERRLSGQPGMAVELLDGCRTFLEKQETASYNPVAARRSGVKIVKTPRRCRSRGSRDCRLQKLSPVQFTACHLHTILTHGIPENGGRLTCSVPVLQGCTMFVVR